MNNSKVVFIIGASSGIGLAVAKKLIKEGHKVYCGARRICPVDEVKSLIVDVVKPETVEVAVKQIIDENGRLDWFVYSAGFSMASPVEYVNEEDYKYLYEVNFFGALRSLKLILPQMRKLGYGRIALIGSMGGLIPIPYDAYYSSSKSALMMLGKNLNLETKRYNIRTVTVLPGGTQTHFTFKRKVYPSNEVGGYYAEMDKSVEILADTELNGMKVNAVANTVVKALKCTCQASFVASGFMNKATLLINKLALDKFIQWVVRMMFKLK